MYHVIVKDPEGRIICQNTEVATLVEGLDILEAAFEEIENSDHYVIDFGLNEAI